MDPKTVLILLVSVYGVASLECNTCKDVVDVALCNTTQICHDGQACFHNLTRSTKVPLMNLGCMDYQQCGTHGTIPNSIVGREIHARQTSNCLECCSTDQCNRVLCEHLKPSTCVDDESIDCAKMNTLFSICTDIDNAKNVCPKFCGLCNVVDGNWSEWSSWSQCDVTCENGSQSRSRSCTNPAPQYGGLNCVGNGVEVKTCQRDLCPVHGGWSKWGEWESCSVSCDMGLQQRTRNCSNPIPIRNGHPCFGHNLDVRQCMSGPCANGGWSDWGTWSSCSVTCGGGIHSKTRSCTNPPPSPFGKDCVGAGIDVGSCATSDCGQSFCKSNPCVNGQCYEVSSDYICICNQGYKGRTCNVLLHVATDCYDIRNMNNGHTTGVYAIELWKTHRYLKVLCDMDTAGGGWTVFQHRFDGSVDFYRNFANYTLGFGNMSGEFWLGLQSVYELVTQHPSELRLVLTAANGTTAYEIFPEFSLSPSPAYTLHIGKGSGTAGDNGNGLSYHNANIFSTYDKGKTDCVKDDLGGWWYANCAYANLNGLYITPGSISGYRSGERGMIYKDFDGYRSLKATKMMFRRV